jgi:2,4-dichlorophenol 6-monooxygenase
VYQPSSCPGARLPHVWLEKDRRPLSTLDIVGGRQFTVLTGIGGHGWRAAAAAIAAAGFPIRCVSIGPSQDYEDPFGDWARASEIEDDGAILVRPDQFVAWRQRVRSTDCESALREALAHIVARVPDTSASA